MSPSSGGRIVRALDKERIKMPTYLYQAAYTAESIAAQIHEPKDRIEVVNTCV
jgi:hypothetical protein